MQSEFDIHTDGGARGNPGPAAIGYIIRFMSFDPLLSKSLHETFRDAKFIGFATNNQAEYEAVISALTEVVKIIYEGDIKKTTIRVFLDSLLVVNQLNGLYKVKAADLRNKLLTVRGLEMQVRGEVRYQYVPRENNSEADALVNHALDMEMSAS